MSCNVEDGVGVGLVGEVIAGGDEIEGELVPGEDAAGAGGRISGQEGAGEVAPVEGFEQRVSAFVERTGFSGGHFVAVENLMGGLGGSAFKAGDVFKDALFRRDADFGADGGEIEELFGERSVHIEDDEAIGTMGLVFMAEL